MALNIAKLSIRRPIFISCIVILIMIMGIIGYNRLGVDMFPPLDYPILTVTTLYPGTTPDEIEKLISKPLEEQLSTISGLKELSSYNMEGVSMVFVEFTYETEVRYAEEKVREKVAIARNNLPQDLLDEPLVRQFDMTDIPIVTLALVADMPATEIYDLAKEKIKPLFEQVNGVGEIRISGGTKREIQVELDRNKLNAYEMSAIAVASQLGNAGANIPVGKYNEGAKSTLFRTIGEFNNIDQIKKAVISFSGDVANSVTVETLGTVRDTIEDPKTLTYFYYPVNSEIDKKTGTFIRKNIDKTKLKREMKPCLILDVFKQSGSNSVEVADNIKAKISKVNDILKNISGNPRLVAVYDMSKITRTNVKDVRDTLIIGIILTIIVVYLFLGNIRSTIITGLAIPTSLLGGFILMYVMGFTLNIMSLLALSLTIGILVDDAIVVRENIFRKLESGQHPLRAAEHGTTEVMLAVIASTLTLMAVFLPIGFLQGIMGRFFKQFGLTVVFVMAVSLFDSLTIAPLLSAYFAGTGQKAKNIFVVKFDKFQDWLGHIYTKVLTFSLNRPIVIILITTVIFIGSIAVFGLVQATFMEQGDSSEYLIDIQMDPGTSLDGTRDTLIKIADRLKTLPELDYMTIQAGTAQNEDHIGKVGVFMVPRKERKRTADELKVAIRNMLKEFSYAKPTIDNYFRPGGLNPYFLSLKCDDLDVLQAYSEKLEKKLETIPDLVEIKSSSQAGIPEFQIRLDEKKMKMLGVTQKIAGLELRFHIEGNVVGKLRDKGLEYDVRLRLKPDQRDLRQAYKETRVPNMMFRMIPLTAIATPENKVGPSRIIRQDRSRALNITANIAPGGAVGTAINRTKEIMEKDLPLPTGVTYSFVGTTEAYVDMIRNLLFAFFLSLVFIYLALSSLYESFITPITVLLALPPALSGAVYALFITGKHMDMFGMIAIIMLMGLVTKNSILLVDFALEGVKSGLSRKEAIMSAGKIRLRPILMTAISTLAGAAPLALGIGEAAQYRQGMGISIIGGLLISTLLTLVVVPALFEYIDKIREKIESKFRPKGSKEVLADYFPESEMSEDLKSVLEKKEIEDHITKKESKSIKGILSKRKPPKSHKE